MKTKVIYTSSCIITTTYPTNAQWFHRTSDVYIPQDEKLSLRRYSKSVPTSCGYSDVFESNNWQTRDRIIVEAQNVES